MGACATKPKVLKTDSGEPPEPAPEHEAAGGGTVSETKVENGGDDKAMEIVDDDKLDSKPRSLTHLFNQNECKESTEIEKQETSETENPKHPPEEKPSAQDEIETKKVIETTHEEKKTETKKEHDQPENGDAFEEKKLKVTDDPEKTKTTPEKGTETEAASPAAPTIGGSEDHKEGEVKVSTEEKVAM